MPVEFILDWDKSIAALVYLASKGLPEFDRYKACKLLFLADKYHLARYARPITGDAYFAVPYGPIPSAILDRLEALEAGNDEQLKAYLELDSKFTHPWFVARVAPDFSVLSQSDLKALDRTIELFGQKNFAELKAITHAMPAYSKAWESRPEGSNRALMQYEDFFEEESEAARGAFEEMIEEDTLRRAFPARPI